MKLSSSLTWPHLSSLPYSFFLWYLNSCFDLQQNTHAVLEAMPPKDQGIITIAAWINIRMCVCLWWGFHGVVFPSTFILCLLFWSLVMWLKSINHQSNSLGSLTHELREEAGVGSVKKAFSEHSLSLVQIGREEQGHYPLKCWVLGGFVGVVWYLWTPSSSLESLLISRVEEAVSD